MTFGNMTAAQNMVLLLLPMFILLLIWSMIWKGFALWRAARENSIAWYIVLFLVNTAGILEILYLFIFSKKAKMKLRR